MLSTRRLFVSTALLIVIAAAPVAAQFRPTPYVAPSGPTCDPSRIDADSYALTTRAQAAIVAEDRLDWWDGFNVGTAFEAVHELNAASTRAAERALELDPNNLLAHGLLARQYVVMGQSAELARRQWQTVFEHGGAVVWTATLYDVDAKSYFILAFDHDALRIYRFGEFAGRVRTHLGVPQFPDASAEELWRAWAGCVDLFARPEAVVPWIDVREIKAGNWVLWFKLDEPVHIASDRTGKRKKLDEIKLNLHGRTGSLEVYKPVGEDRLAMRGRGPAGYQDMVRRTLASFVDPEKRLALPPVQPGVGW